jgi:dTMP kinase
MSGRLIVFEGPDGIGKSKLSELTCEWLRAESIPATALSFPGNSPQTLGQLVYEIHHQHRERFAITSMDPLSLQTLHVAAHIDEVQRAIKPALNDGKWVVLDRFWWSTWVYGMAAGAFEPSLNHLIEAEKLFWQPIEPSALFLISRREAIRKEHSTEMYERLSSFYGKLSEREGARYLHSIENDVLESSLHQVTSVLAQIIVTARNCR